MVEAVAFHPLVTVFPARTNAQLILGTHADKHVIVKVAVPDRDGTEEETMEILFETGDEGEARAQLLAMLNLNPRKQMKIV